MTIQVDSTDALIKVSFSNDADPDFHGQAVFLLADWQGWTPLQKGVRLAARYQEWVATRAPVDQAVQYQQRIQALRERALAKWQDEHDLGLTATVNSDGSVTVT